MRKMHSCDHLITLLFKMVLTASFTALVLPSIAASQEIPAYGPAKGTLVIVGGGDDKGTGIMETFVNRAGGLGAKIVIIPTVGGKTALRNETSDGAMKPIVSTHVVSSDPSG